MAKNSKNDLTSWMDSKNFEQCQWAFGYLLKKGFYANMSVKFPDDHAWLSHYLEEFKETLTESPDNKIFMERMRGAWRQRMDRQSRKKRRKNSYSFVIGTGASKQLSELAEKSQQRRNAALEWLIEDAYNGIKKNEFELKKQKQKLKEKETEYKNLIKERLSYVPPALLENAETRIKTLEEENSKLQKKLKKLSSYLKKRTVSKQSENERKTVRVEVKKKKT